MKNNISKILGVVLTVVTLASVFVIAAPTSAATVAQSWNSYGIPSGTGMVLNTTITVGGPIAQASDSSALYAYVLDGTSNKIIKSTDNGRTWKNPVVSGAPGAAVIEIVCSPTEANVVFYITATTLFMSTDSGVNFTAVLNCPAGSAFTTLDVAKWGTPSRYIAVLGTQINANTPAGVYYWDQSLPFNNLTAVGTTTFAGAAVAGTVLSVRMAPTFATDRTVVAVGEFGASTAVRMDINGGAWGAIVPDIAIVSTGAVGADIAFPSDFNYATSPIYFVCLNDATAGGVYRVIGNSVSNVYFAQLDTNNMSFSGSFASATGAFMIGTATGDVIMSTNSGNSFAVVALRSFANTATAWVLLDRNFATTKLAWVLNAGGVGGALNVTTDGVTFNQWSLINGAIAAAGGIVSFAAGSNGDLYIITQSAPATDTAIWRQLNSAGTPWERVYFSAAPTYTNITLAADYATGKDLAVWTLNQTTPILVSTNNANKFTAMTTPPQVITPATAISISSLYLINATTVVVGDDTGTIVTNQTSSGVTSAFWWTGVNGTPFGSAYVVNSIVNAGGTNLLAAAWSVADSKVKVAKSADNGLTWTALTKTITATGAAFVAPADDYATTGALYVATTPGVWMYPSATGTFTRVDGGATGGFAGTVSTVGAGSGIVTAAAANTSAEGTGVIYAADSTALSGNVARIRGHQTTAEKLLPGAPADTFSGLWLGTAAAGNINVWTVDTTATGLWFYNDTLAVQGTGVTVSNLATAAGGLFGIVPAATSANVSWTALTNATDYYIVVNQVPQTSLYTAVNGLGAVNLAGIPAAVGVLHAAGTTTAAITNMAPGASYFVSIWANAPVSSFMFGTTINAPLPPVGPATPLVPTLGAEDVDVQPSFAWASVTSATSYSLQLTLATDSAYASPIINVNNIPAVAGQPTVTYNWNGAALANNTSYIWRVAANLTGGGSSAWVLGNFRTEKVVLPPVTVSITTQPQQTIIFPTNPPPVTVTINPPVTPVLTVTQPIITLTTPPAGPTPTYIWIIVAVGAVLTLAVIVLIIRTRRVV